MKKAARIRNYITGKPWAIRLVSAILFILMVAIIWVPFLQGLRAAFNRTYLTVPEQCEYFVDAMCTVLMAFIEGETQ